MIYPTAKTKEEWSLPLLILGVFPIIRGVVNSHVAGIADRFKIFRIRVSSIHVAMMNQQGFSFPFVSNLHKVITFSSTKFTSIFAKLYIQTSTVFIISILVSRMVSALKSLFDRLHPLGSEHLAFIRAVLRHSIGVNFVAWCHVWLTAVKTFKDEVIATTGGAWFFSKNFSNKIVHYKILYGLYEGL